jgi:hypothetical protein
MVNHTIEGRGVSVVTKCERTETDEKSLSAKSRMGIGAGWGILPHSTKERRGK